jgi:hypothetical protein
MERYRSRLLQFVQKTADALEFDNCSLRENTGPLEEVICSTPHREKYDRFEAALAALTFGRQLPLRLFVLPLSYQ